MSRRVVVVGGGVSGLAFAHRLLERDPDVELTILEASTRAGGILGTVERDGFVIETGPDSILSEKRAAIELAQRLGIGDRLIETRAEHRGAYVVSRGALEKVPEGFSLMAPTRWDTWATTPLVSPAGRLRAALEPLIPARRNDAEESMAGFVRRRFGREVLERLAQPLIGGIYGGDPDRLSLAATMPRFVDLERRHGSVIRGMRAGQRRASEQAAGGARYGLFVAFDRGMQTLIDALAARLGPRLSTGRRVTSIEVGAPSGARFRISASAGSGTPETIEADRLALALPAWRAAALLEPHSGTLSDALFAIPYGSAATVTFAWPRREVPHPLDAFGFVVPTVERRSVLAATFSSVKWPGRAPEGQVLLRVFLGGAHAADVTALDDEALVQMARRELRSLMGIHTAPRFSLVRRYARAMPQYQLGHLERVDAIEAMTRDVEGLTLVGNAYRGVGIPDTVRYAEAAADRETPEGSSGETS